MIKIRKFVSVISRHFFNEVRILSSDIKTCIWLWTIYLKHTIIKKKYEPKTLFCSNFKNNDNYTQICYNSIRNIPQTHDIPFFSWVKQLTLKPIMFFQRFPDKANNVCFGERNSHFTEKHNLRITYIKPSTYYEGITFNNITFDSININKICFHNCIFRNCDFIKIGSNISINLFPELAQGFSACDFYNCNFKDCTFDNIFFSIGSLICTTFDNMSFNKCLFHRISFNNVEFTGKTILNQTSILSPSHHFNITFRGAIEDFNIDSRCKVTGFSYNDIVNFSIHEYKTYKIYKKLIFEEVANTYYCIDQIWASNHIREEDAHMANFYYQRKKAETRSKGNISAIPCYLLELSIGYGEKPFRAFVSIFLLIFLFSFIYMLTGFSPSSSAPTIKYFCNRNFTMNYQIFSDWRQSLYYSFFTFITVGQGSSSPSTGATQIAMSIELLCGSILMTLFTATLFRKYTK